MSYGIWLAMAERLDPTLKTKEESEKMNKFDALTIIIEALGHYQSLSEELNKDDCYKLRAEQVEQIHEAIEVMKGCFK